MTYDDAKQLLNEAHTADDRRKVVETALAMGVPLHRLEEYMDWLDANRPAPGGFSKPSCDEPEHHGGS